MKFITPVSMKVTQKQFEKDLKSQLESLGYYYDDEFVWSLLSQYLITYIEDDDNCFFFNQDENGDDCYYIDHYNPELFLALAARNDGDDIINGEWVIGTIGDSEYFLQFREVLDSGKISCHKYVASSSPDGYLYGGYFERIKRKATKEEIINHLPFKVPEKWYVKPNNIEEAKILAKYFDDNKCATVFGSSFYSDKPNEALANGLSNHYGYYKGTYHTEITFEQFKKYILKQETMKTYPITRKQLAEIYNIACAEWKEKISKLTQDTLGSFKEEGELDDRIVREMFKAATSEQKPTLEKIFGVQDKNAFVKKFETNKLENISEELFGDKYCLLTADRSAKNIGRNDLIGRSLVINSDYNVTFHSDGDSTLLEITKK